MQCCVTSSAWWQSSWCELARVLAYNGGKSGVVLEKVDGEKMTKHRWQVAVYMQGMSMQEKCAVHAERGSLELRMVAWWHGGMVAW
jgi:hypothetical protein